MRQNISLSSFKGNDQEHFFDRNIKMFGRSRSAQKDDATTGPRNMMANEEEGWEVVKPTKLDSHLEAKIGAETTDTSAKSEVFGCEVSQELKEFQRVLSSTSFLVESDLYFPEETSTTSPSSNSMDTVEVIPGIPIQDLLACIDFSQMVEQGTKGYYLVKRNLKTVALLFLLGVFCVNSVPSSRSKRESNSSSSLHEILLHRREEAFDSDVLLTLLTSELEEVEESNRQLERELSKMIFERNNWRSAALSCDQDLREMTAAHSRLEKEVRQSKWLAPVAFVSPAPRVNATALAAIAYLAEEALPVPEPSPAKRIPYPQLALPKPDPVHMLPMPSMKAGHGKPYSAVVLAPSVAVMAI